MELPLLQHPADMLIVIRGPGIRTRVRMAPRTRKIRAILRLQEGDQSHLAHCRDPSQSRERFACVRKLAVRDAVGLRNSDACLAKPLDDGVMQVAADRQ